MYSKYETKAEQAERRLSRRPIRRIRRAFDRRALKRVCEAPEYEFGEMYDMDEYDVQDRWAADGEDYFFHKDSGSNILYVAHLDTVVDHRLRTTGFADSAEGLVVHSGALDDRLGAYVGLHLLPELGLTFDVLLTVGEERGSSTAAYFQPDKQYNWIIEFDRGGTDVVMYEYEDFETRQLVRDSGARVGVGSYSDIAYLNHLGIKAFNWGVGYHDYHSTKGYAYLEDTFSMVHKFMRFHAENKDTVLPHTSKKWNSKSANGVGTLDSSYYLGESSSAWEDYWDARYGQGGRGDSLLDDDDESKLWSDGYHWINGKWERSTPAPKVEFSSEKQVVAVEKEGQVISTEVLYQVCLRTGCYRVRGNPVHKEGNVFTAKEHPFLPGPYVPRAEVKE